ncbi:MAG: lysylphosphatidylglycerol synthase transmembrane domain-containing protein [Candidatus Cloacimonetes bacterium]|nr:lysylphosphatidylglycerol synthase transmembrane domain-containing protein [Candidatus Cloacimonadota bacterium]
MTKSNRNLIHVVLGIVISMSLVVALIKFVDIRQVWTNIQQLSFRTMSLLLFIYLVNVFVRTYRWKYLIEQKYQINMKVTFKALIYGFMLNQLLPAKIGEVARAEYLTRKKKFSRSYLLGTIAIERAFDLIIIVMFLGVSVLFSDMISKHVKSNVIPIFLILSGFATIFIALYHLAEFKRLTKYLPGKIELKVNRIIDNLISSSQLFHSLKQSSWLLLLTLAIWSLTCVTVYIVLSNFGVTLPFYAYFFVVSAGTFGMIIPSTSANVGVYHAVAMGSIMLFGVSKETALSYAVVAHAFDFFPAIILGGTLFGYDSLKQIMRRFRAA